jgi:hypothetical protein
MRIRLLLSALLLAGFLPSLAMAQTAITAETAQKYYQNCIRNAQSDQTMKPQTKDVFCQCTAIHMQKNMVMEDIVAMSGNDQAARNALNKMLTGVHAPCMEYPVRDLIGKKCEADIARPDVCNCLSDKMASYTAREAQRLLGQVLATNPNITDPMGAIMETDEFKRNEQQLALSCAQLAQ